MDAAHCSVYCWPVYSGPAVMADDVLAENLKRLRGKTPQKTVEARCGVPQSSISKYENGEAQPDLRTVMRLAVGLNADLELIVAGLDADYEASRASRTLSANEALLQGSPSTEARQKLEKRSPGSANAIDTRDDSRAQSAHATPQQIAADRAREGSHVDLIRTGAAGALSPAHRRSPDVHDRAGLAAALIEFADTIGPAFVQQTLYTAAAALLDREGGSLVGHRSSKDPRAGGSRSGHARRGKS